MSVGELQSVRAPDPCCWPKHRMPAVGFGVPRLLTIPSVFVACSSPLPGPPTLPRPQRSVAVGSDTNVAPAWVRVSPEMSGSPESCYCDGGVPGLHEPQVQVAPCQLPSSSPTLSPPSPGPYHPPPGTPPPKLPTGPSYLCPTPTTGSHGGGLCSRAGRVSRGPLVLVFSPAFLMLVSF